MPEIYFIQLHSYVKIGLSADSIERLKDLQYACPYDLRIIRTIKDCTYRHETWLHKQYIALHIRSEWFIFCDDMLTIKIPDLPLSEWERNGYKYKGRYVKARAIPRGIEISNKVDTTYLRQEKRAVEEEFKFLIEKAGDAAFKMPSEHDLATE